MSQESGYNLAGSSAQGLRGCNQGVCWAALSFGGIIGEEPASELTKVVERIHFLEVIGLRVLASCSYYVGQSASKMKS